MDVLSSSPMIGLDPAIQVLYVHDRYVRSFGHLNIARPLPMTSRMSHVEVLVSRTTCCLCLVAVLINTMYQSQRASASTLWRIRGGRGLNGGRAGRAVDASMSVDLQ
jgi:hypothetical protein